MRVVLESLGVVAGGYLLLVGGLAAFQRDMIYHPGAEVAEPAAVGLPEMTPVPVRAADGLVTTGWYAPPSRPSRPTVVFFHGNGGTLVHRADKARVLLDAGFGLFLAEYRGYAGNPGRPSEEGLYHDARAVLTWLGARGLPPGRLVLYGESLGTGVAVQMASERQVAAVVLEAPFTRLPELAPAYVLPPLADLLMVDRYDNLAKIGGVKAPLLVLHGEQDTVCPPAMGRALLAAADTDKEAAFLPQADHTDLWDRGAGETVVDFLDRRQGG